MPILSKLLTISALLLAAATGSAQTSTMATVNSLADAERNFARAGVERGIRESFLQNFAEDGIIFAPGPTNAKAFYTKYEDNGRRLFWQPMFAVVSSEADLGFTTGPWELKKSAADDTSLAFGQFVSVWKKQPDKSWKVLVDVGIDHPQPSGPPGEIQLFPPNDTLQNGADAKVQRSAFDKTEQKLNDSLKIDAGAALLEAGGDDLRIFRDNSFPAVGKAAAQLLLGADHAKVTRVNLAGGMSASGDLAYRYGSYTAANASQRGYYLTLWNVDLSGNWKVVIDLQKKVEAK
jgi:ketosteroid isomerase-like protein